MVDLLGSQIFSFMLIFARIGGFFAAAPLFSWPVVPLQAKLTAALALAIFFGALTPAVVLLATDTTAYAIVALAGQTCYGLALGLLAYCLLAVIRLGGTIIEQQIGLTMAEVLDPFSEQPAEPIGMALEIFFVMMLLNTEGHHLLIRILGETFIRFGGAGLPSLGALFDSLMQASALMLMLALQLAAPILAAFLLLLVVLAFMARIAPETNILFLSFPLRCGLGLLAVGLFVPFLSNYLKAFSFWLTRLLPW